MNESDASETMFGCVLEEYNSNQSSRNVYSKKEDNTLSVVEKETKDDTSLKNVFMTVFLPEGYPDSVSDDYFDYQFWDTLQAFASSVTNTLATHAILKGIGVGDSTATPIAATITWLMRDGTGMLGRIAFAYLQGSKLDADCKKWRLFADIINDVSIGIDIITPYFAGFTTLLQCFSSLGRSLVGITGSATRAALTQHQARRNNLADVSAKDGSQETVVNLIALIFSLTVIPIILLSTNLIWITFIGFTLFHIYANYSAVRAVSMEIVNFDRFAILVEEYLKSGIVQSVKEVNSKENVLPLVWSEYSKYPCKIGVSIQEHVKDYTDLMALRNCNNGCSYLLSLNHSETVPIKISLNEKEDSLTILEAAFQAILIHFCRTNKTAFDAFISDIIEKYSSYDSYQIISKTRKFTEVNFPIFVSKAIAEGWDFSRNLLLVDGWRIKTHLF